MKASRWLLPLGVASIVASLLTLVVIIGGVEARILENLWGVDPETGYIVPRLNPRQFSHPYSSRFEYWVWPISMSVLVFTALLAYVLHRVDGERRVGLASVLLPLVLPVLVGLATATLMHPYYQDWLEDVYRLLSSELPLDARLNCHDVLVPCSHVHILDTVRIFSVSLVVAVTLIALVPSARAVWRAGEVGARLGNGWCGAALVCFITGTAALLATRAHRADRGQLVADCARGRVTWCERTILFDVTPSELQGVELESCDRIAEFETFAVSDGTTFQLFETGDLSELSRPDTQPELLGPAALRERLATRVVAAQFGGAVGLLVDTRTQLSALTDTLRPMKEVGVEVVLLLGNHTLSGELATLGPWRRRVHCRLGFLRFDDFGRNLEEFEDFTALAMAASAAGPAGLRIKVR